MQEIFNIEFEKEETVYNIGKINGTNVIFIHINLDHSSPELVESIDIYDKDNVRGVPQFSLITLGYNRGFIQPYYTSAYGTLNLNNDEGRKELLMKIIQDGIDLYNENYEGYDV